MRWMLLALLALLWMTPVSLEAGDAEWRLYDQGVKLVGGDQLTRTAIGVTRQETPIAALVANDDFDPTTFRTRLLLVAGLDGNSDSVQRTIAALGRFYIQQPGAPVRQRFALAAVPCANPDALKDDTGPANASGGNPTRGYPPSGEAYHSKTDPEAAYLWRWIGMHAPDLVIEVQANDDEEPKTEWYVVADAPEPLAKLAEHLAAKPLPVDDSLVTQLPTGKPSNTGSVPAIRVRAASEAFLDELLSALVATRFAGPSPARAELARRLERSPREVARQLAEHYGHELARVEYIPAVALIGRLRLGLLDNDPSHQADVEKIVAPYVGGDKPTYNDRPSSSGFPGHLVFGELARATNDPRYIELVRRAADFGFDAQGQPLKSMPSHNEMSDSVFMGCPILAMAGRLTGDTRYYDMCLKHMRFMLDLNLRDDGLHQHSPLDPAAWGRGNGFPALGLSLVLAELPDDYPGRQEVLDAHVAHLRALLKHQDPTGAWHQVVDHPGSYRELTSTCMITFAMAHGVRQGWLNRDEFDAAIRRGWAAVKTRVGDDGGLVDVCTGTGKQKSQRDYFDRTAILGRDARGGAMSLLVATEMARYLNDK